MMKKMTVLTLAAVLGAAPAIAQMQGMDHSSMNHGQMMQPTAANPYPPAEMQMHQKMMSVMGADATETWVRKMVEHHRGGIGMSQIVLRETNDAKVRQMATKTIAEQNKEVGELNAWLRAHGKRPQ